MNGKNAALLILLALLPVFSLQAVWAAPQDTGAPTPDLQAGRKLFESECSVCHGIDGGGGRGPNLHTPRLKHASDDKGLRAVITNGIAPDMPAAWLLSDDEVAKVAVFVKSLGTMPPANLPGDPAHGQAVYQKAKCMTCHIMAGKGNGFGPDLTSIGAQRGGVQLRETVLHPDRTLPETFLMVEAVPSSGEPVQGLRVNEDTFTIQLKDASGHMYSLRKSDLKELRKLRGQTPMPSFERMLSNSEVDDLVAFLASQRGQQ
jgi:putative heme-binding domain-containing protein